MTNPLTIGLAPGFATRGRDYTGRDSWARNRQYGAGYRPPTPYMGVQAQQGLLFRSAFFGPVREAGLGGRIRDNMTNENLRNIPRTPDELLDPTISHPSYSDVLEARLDARSERYIDDAWKDFSAGRFQEAVGRFSLAAAGRRMDVEPALGTLFGHVALGQMASALNQVDRLLSASRTESDDLGAEVQILTNPFLCNVDLIALIPDPSQTTSGPAFRGEAGVADHAPAPWSRAILDAALQQLSLAASRPDQPRAAAEYAILLWFSGDREGAQRVADAIRRDHRTTPYARLALDMQAAKAQQDRPIDEPVAVSVP